MAARTLPPGPPGHFPLGNMRAFSRDTLSLLLEARRYGDFVTIHFGPYIGFIASHPDLMHQILVTDADKFNKPAITKQVMEPVVGKGLFTNEGESWKRQRRLTQPAFHTRRIGAYADVMVKHTLRRIAAWTPGSTQPIDHEMAELTMSIIAETLFNAEVGPEADAIGAAVTTVLSIMNERFNRLIPTPNWLPIPENRVFKREIARLDALIQRFIDERRRTGEDRGDLLSMLLLARDEDDGGFMTDKQVRDEAITLFGAGHETTSNALMWTFYCLSEHPEVEARLHAEVDSVLGDRPPTLEDLPRLPYTEMVIKESMRLYPPAWATTREPNTDVIVGGWPVRRGELILLNIYGVHRDARFFPDPERFDPERFRPENEKLIPKYAYLPFGSGPRVCIGNAFAMMEARLILATIAQRFALRLAPGHTVKPERMFTLRAKGGMPMIVVPRQPAVEPASALAEPV